MEVDDDLRTSSSYHDLGLDLDPNRGHAHGRGMENESSELDKPLDWVGLPQEVSAGSSCPFPCWLAASCFASHLASRYLYGSGSTGPWPAGHTYSMDIRSVHIPSAAVVVVLVAAASLARPGSAAMALLHPAAAPVALGVAGVSGSTDPWSAFHLFATQ